MPQALTISVGDSHRGGRRRWRLFRNARVLLRERSLGALLRLRLWFRSTSRKDRHERHGECGYCACSEHVQILLGWIQRLLRTVEQSTCHRDTRSPLSFWSSRRATNCHAWLIASDRMAKPAGRCAVSCGSSRGIDCAKCVSSRARATSATGMEWRMQTTMLRSHGLKFSPITLGLLAGALLASGCVTTGTYDKKVSELAQVTADHDKAAAERESALKARIGDLEKDRTELEAKLDAATAEKNALQKSLDDTTALAGELKTRLEKLGQNVEKLTSEKGQLSRVLDDAKGRLEELRKQKLAAEARAATFRSLMQKLRSMIDAGQLKVVIRDGRMLIALDSDVLFDSGKTSLKPAGESALSKLAVVLSGITDRKYQVAGHTDDVPIHTARFASNWELSTARAVEVVRFLISNGMKPQQLSAAGVRGIRSCGPERQPPSTVCRTAASRSCFCPTCPSCPRWTIWRPAENRAQSPGSATDVREPGDAGIQASQHGLSAAQACGIDEHAAGPAVHVRFRDLRAHGTHAASLLVFAHGERPSHGGAGFFQVVGIDDQRLRQLAGSSGEAAQQQNAQLVLAGCHEFLGDQVHAVVQAADVAQIRRAVVTEHRRGARGGRAERGWGASRRSRSGY